MNGDKKKELGANEQVPESSKVSMERRKFAKAGVIAPVLMTFSSRPAWAACTLSGVMSGNLSNQGSGEVCAGALSADYWNANRNQWGDAGSFGVDEFFSIEPAYFGGTLTNIYDVGYSGSIATPLVDYGDEFKNAFIELLIQAIASSLNAFYFTDRYPMTMAEVQQQVAAAYQADRAESSKTLKNARASTKMRTSNRRSNRNARKKGGAMRALAATMKGYNDVNSHLR